MVPLRGSRFWRSSACNFSRRYHVAHAGPLYRIYNPKAVDDRRAEVDPEHQREWFSVEALPVLIFGQPIRYAFEGLISNEFHTLNGTCSFLIPSGPGYENVSITNQVCGTVGSIPGQSTVDGNRYIALMFDYSYSHIWLVSDTTP